MDERASYNDVSASETEDMPEMAPARLTQRSGEQVNDMITASNDEVQNPTPNRPFTEILNARASRRAVLAGGLSLAAGSFFGYVGDAQARKAKFNVSNAERLLGFTALTVPAYLQGSMVDGVSARIPAISPEYQYTALIPWGSSVNPALDTPEYDGDPSTRPTADDQTNLIGIGHDGMWFFPMDGTSNTEGMLAINHEFGINPTVIGKDAPESLDDVRLSQHAHGVSVVAIAEVDGVWTQVANDNARRIHVNTPVTFSGPAADSPLLENPANNPPAGTVNNCANGYTPWGTYLTCEENFNGYFGFNEPEYVLTESQERYGFSDSGFGYGWHLFDPRFDLSNPDYVNEHNRFGWVVEIDPNDGTQVPVKRTAMGRVKHEGVAVIEGASNRAVCYMGDDQRFDFIYKFVSEADWEQMFAEGRHPLDHGTLFAARFNEDGTGEWLEISLDNPDVAAAGFADIGEVLVNTRLAADAAGATPMNRPEWITVAPNGEVYCACTNNSQREEELYDPTAEGAYTPGETASNPFRASADGHILKWIDSDDHVGTTFEWDIFVVCADVQAKYRDEEGEYIESNARQDTDSFSDPDGMWCDPDGRLFIQTDGGQDRDLQDQMLVADIESGLLKRIFGGVSGDEITGITVTPDRRTMFINIQHPGNGDPEDTNFPLTDEAGAFTFDGTTIPRDCTVVITKRDGGIIGS